MSIADELIKRGWTQHDFMAEDGSVCLFGAAACAAGYDEQRVRSGDFSAMEQSQALVEVIRSRHNVGLVAAFNDAPERTFDEVLRVAKEADEILASESQP